MKIDILVAEIGSTTTVVNAFDNINSNNPVFLGQGHAATSVLQGDVRIGLEGALESLREVLKTDSLDYETMLATSSAAGGLKMTVHGLVPDMTARAAKEAALGAGAVIKLITCGKLTDSDIRKIKSISPNIILVAGGVDYGERETALYNAEKLSELDLDAPVIYAGNIENQDDIADIFKEKIYIVDNVYPKIDVLNVEPARKVIHNVFEEHIVHAPGMSHIRDMVNGAIIPTPGAVMESAKLLYDDIGPLVMIDVGGATTDIHSVTEGSPEITRLMLAPEPLAKRTVEGDLGVYVNAANIIEILGHEYLSSEFGFDAKEVLEDYKAIPKNSREILLVERLTKAALEIALKRHAGRIKTVYGPSGRISIAEGKDLTDVKYVIGTGGALTRLPGRMNIMKSVSEINNTMGEILLPKGKPSYLIDNDYIIASLGVLIKVDHDAALKLMKKSLRLV